MLSLQTVLPNTLELLKRLMAVPLLSPLRLVGGTSLALQYGHRRSVDLDFFGNLHDISIPTLHKCLEDVGVINSAKESEHIRIYEIDGIKVDFVDYSRFPWIDDAVVEKGLRLASPRDIAAMKINAIEGRGSRKDFIDMYFLLHHYSLKEILQLYQQKYPDHSIFRALMSLTYFTDAEGQMMPEMFVSVTWEEMKAYIKREVEKIE
ncbi:MAG: nucleotidyl transferase AbiEii/AbiGii toxin family protein [Bacteroidaceae bacterium]|nr:nucleotidyl transferase AbiEii/AbiGii toxin family protein [Bacteroidaceae bacterium]